MFRACFVPAKIAEAASSAEREHEHSRPHVARIPSGLAVIQRIVRKSGYRFFRNKRCAIKNRAA